MSSLNSLLHLRKQAACCFLASARSLQAQEQSGFEGGRLIQKSNRGQTAVMFHKIDYAICYTITPRITSIWRLMPVSCTR